jgi:hypothetical protein
MVRGTEGPAHEKQFWQARTVEHAIDAIDVLAPERGREEIVRMLAGGYITADAGGCGTAA